MKKAQHTPGPWKLHRHVSGGECIVTDDDKMTHIMLIQEARGLGDESPANARLIAAAPELLEQLKIAQSQIGAWAHEAGQRGSLGYHNLMEGVTAAIAKAEGK